MRCKWVTLKNYLELENLEQGTGKVINFQDTLEVVSKVMTYKKGDVLFGKLRPYLEKYHLAKEDGYCTGEILAIEPKLIDNTYFKYFIGSPNFIKQCDVFSYGAKMPRVNWQTQIGTFEIPLPPLKEQKAIAEYLDKATTRIDRIITIKQEQLVKMEEMRESKYQEIITKGLNETINYTESNIPSLGKYPNHWKLIKLKLVSKKIGDGMHSTPIYTEDTDYPFINGNNLINGRITLKEKTRTVSKVEFEKHKLNLTSDTVLISINGTIGNLALYNNEKVVFGKSSAYIELLSRVNREFLYFFLKSYYIKDLIELSLEGTTVRNLSLNTIRNFKILLPPKGEQMEIVDFLNKFSIKVESEIDNIKSQIKTLQAYRKSLIHECVTGKKQIISKTAN